MHRSTDKNQVGDLQFIAISQHSTIPLLSLSHGTAGCNKDFVAAAPRNRPPKVAAVLLPRQPTPKSAEAPALP
jgi:hypothetical protein